MLTSLAIPRDRVLGVVPTLTPTVEEAEVGVTVGEVVGPGAAIYQDILTTQCTSPDRWAVEVETRLWH